MIEDTGLLSVDMEAFEGLVSLNRLHLNNGPLTHQPSLHYIPKTIVWLELKHNRITRINDTYFAGCAILKRIDFQGNLLPIPPNIDDIAHSLSSVSLSMNRISGAFRYFTKTFRKLSELYLENNHITYFCMMQRRHLPFLKVLNLRGNNVTHVNFITGLKRYLSLSLFENPYTMRKYENVVLHSRRWCKKPFDLWRRWSRDFYNWMH